VSQSCCANFSIFLIGAIVSVSLDQFLLHVVRINLLCSIKEQYEDAIIDCTKALEFNPDYMKALVRRAQLYEKTEKLDEALEDFTNALERDCSLHVARAACMVKYCDTFISFIHTFIHSYSFIRQVDKTQLQIDRDKKIIIIIIL